MLMATGVLVFSTCILSVARYLLRRTPVAVLDASVRAHKQG